MEQLSVRYNDDPGGRRVRTKEDREQGSPQSVIAPSERRPSGFAIGIVPKQRVGPTTRLIARRPVFVNDGGD